MSIRHRRGGSRRRRCCGRGRWSWWRRSPPRWMRGPACPGCVRTSLKHLEAANGRRTPAAAMHDDHSYPSDIAHMSAGRRSHVTVSGKTWAQMRHDVPCAQVSAADVAAVVAAWTRIPVETLAAADAVRLQRLPEALAVSFCRVQGSSLLFAVAEAGRQLSSLRVSCNGAAGGGSAVEWDGRCGDRLLPRLLQRQHAVTPHRRTCCFRAGSPGKRRQSRRRRGRCSGLGQGCGTASAPSRPCCSAARPASARPTSRRRRSSPTSASLLSSAN
jgi:hypothetical protein